MSRSPHLIRAIRAIALGVAGLSLLGCGESATPAAPWQLQLRAAEQAFRAKDFAQAGGLYTDALDLARAAGSASGSVSALDGLAATHAVQGDLAAAESLYVELLDLQRRAVAADSLSGMYLVRSLGSLSEINLSRGDIDAAHSCLAQILALDADGTIDLHPEEGALAYTLHGLGEIMRAKGDSVRGATYVARAGGLQMYAQGFAQYVGDDLSRAEDSLRRALAHQTQALGPGHEDVARTAHLLGRLYEYRGRRVEAVAQYRHAVRAFAASATAPLDHAAALEDLATAISRTEPAAADSLRRQATTVRQQAGR